MYFSDERMGARVGVSPGYAQPTWRMHATPWTVCPCKFQLRSDFLELANPSNFSSFRTRFDFFLKLVQVPELISSIFQRWQGPGSLLFYSRTLRPPKFKSWVCGLTREKLNEFTKLSLLGSSKLCLFLDLSATGTTWDHSQSDSALDFFLFV